LLDADGEGAPVFGADESQAKEGQARHRAPVDAGEEAVHAKGGCPSGVAGFGHNHFVASEEIDIVGAEEMLAKEEAEELRPGDGGGEEALDGAIAGAVATPARDPQHGHPPRHGQEGCGNAAEVAHGGDGHTGLKTEHQC